MALGAAAHHRCPDRSIQAGPDRLAAPARSHASGTASCRPALPACHDPDVDPVVGLVGLYRVAGSLLVLRWPFWGGVAAVVCDLFDLLLFNLFAVRGGWPGIDPGTYQAFDKWADQVYLAAFLYVALRDFAPGPRLIAAALWLFRFAGFLAFEAGWVPREALLLFPNLFEPWFIAVAFTLRYRPAFGWTPARSAVALAVLLGAKLLQEWALHVGRLFDELTFLGVLEAAWEAVTGR
jgi:hypothetical protein